MKRFKLFISLVFASVFLSVNVVPAVIAEEQTTEPTEQTEQTTQPSTPEEIKARVEERKAKMQTALAAAEKLRIATRCKTAQGRVNVAQNAGFGTKRLNAYNEIVGKLSKLIDKLKAAGVDTTKLEGNLEDLKAKVEVFKTDLDAYKQALQDLKEMTCADDPEGFKASLEEARQLMTTVKDDAKAIHQFMKDVIKVTLKEMRAAIAEVNNTTTKPAERTGDQQ